MSRMDDIKRIDEIYDRSSAKWRINFPEKAAVVYAFWWMDDEHELKNANRKITMPGPGGEGVDVKYEDWPEGMLYPCLYVGRSTKIKQRFRQHIIFGKKEVLHRGYYESNVKQKLYRPSCQLRRGIEHLFIHTLLKSFTPLDIIFRKVGFSYERIDQNKNAVAERCFREHQLIGEYRPWFNIESER